MKTSLLVQQLVIFCLVVFSAFYTLRKLAPGAYRRGQVALAIRLLKPQRPAFLRRLGRRLAPTPNAVGFFKASAASSCGGCNNCGPADPKK